MKGIKFRMERIDKIISSQGKYSRSEIKKLASQGRIKINDNIVKKVNEKIILLSIIGSLDAIKEEAVSIDEIEKFLFSPHIYHKLKQKGYSGDILQIIEEGCELEDIFSLLPDKFDGVIDNMRRKSLLLLKNYEEYNHFFWLDE